MSIGAIHTAGIFFFISYYRVKFVDNNAQTNLGVDSLEDMDESL